MHPQPLAPEASNLLLKYTPEILVVELEGIAPSSLACRTSILLLNYSSIATRIARHHISHGDRTCTCNLTGPGRALFC